MGLNQFIGITTLLYALANPVGIIPIFLGLMHKNKNVNVPRVITLAAISVAGLLIFSALLGKHILAFFDVGLDDFRIAGGLLALFVAFEMFQARYGGIIQTVDEKAEAEHDIHGIAITPLAFPLLIGPAEMSIMITLSNDMQGWKNKVLLVSSSVITSMLIAITLVMATPVKRIIGTTGINVATRIMALFVAAIGVHFIMTGIKNQWHVV